MARKLTIGLVFSNNENWIGGTYYILNLVQALNTLPDDIKPNLIFFIGKPEDAEIIKAIGYPNLTFYPLSFEYSGWEKLVNKISIKILKKSVIQKKYPAAIVDLVFPYDFQASLGNIKNKVCWIPDFQEHYLKDFFSQDVLAYRKQSHLAIIKQGYPIVFSSDNTKNSFQEIYPQAKNRTYVINFATTHPEYNHLEIRYLKEKYAIQKPYIISPNQFWKHKNHQIIIEAVEQLVKKRVFDAQIVFTGKEYDFRYPDYAENLKRLVKEKGLEEYIKFLGFIDRAEQLQLMNHALSVIQPSLFEGWSTVVEDAKAMSQVLLVSDIAVHQEQLKDYPNKIFFNPYEVVSLSDTLEVILKKDIAKEFYDYDKDVKKFAQAFFKIADTIIK